MPGVCDSAIPTWNISSDNYFETLFSFAQSNLHDDAVILIIHSAEPQVLRTFESGPSSLDTTKYAIGGA